MEQHTNFLSHNDFLPFEESLPEGALLRNQSVPERLGGFVHYRTPWVYVEVSNERQRAVDPTLPKRGLPKADPLNRLLGAHRRRNTEMVALITVACLWLLVGLVVAGATRPSDSVAVALADETPVVHSPEVALAS